MSGLNLAIGAPVIALGLHLIVGSALPETRFLTVHEMSVEDGIVTVERTIEQPRTVADWRVTVVAQEKDAPSCQTIPGSRLHQGWSVYVPEGAKRETFKLDVWVGDEGCLERLPHGVFDMFVTWTPRDGRSAVTERSTFEN